MRVALDADQSLVPVSPSLVWRAGLPGVPNCCHEHACQIRRGADGTHDQLIISVTRELLRNVSQHANASLVTINLQRMDGEVILEVADDGSGMNPDRPAEALEAGHVGLASIAMRADACGGRFELTSHPGEGTRVRLAPPAQAPDAE